MLTYTRSLGWHDAPDDDTEANATLCFAASATFAIRTVGRGGRAYVEINANHNGPVIHLPDFVAPTVDDALAGIASLTTLIDFERGCFELLTYSPLDSDTVDDDLATLDPPLVRLTHEVNR